MKKFALIVAVAGTVGWAAYVYRDRLLAGMLNVVTRLQALEEDPTEEEELESSYHYPKKEEDLGAR